MTYSIVLVHVLGGAMYTYIYMILFHQQQSLQCWSLGFGPLIALRHTHVAHVLNRFILVLLGVRDKK